MRYDIIVIGAGSGGLNIAGFMNKAGFKVLLIDKDDKSIGGDCLNTGCIPSKALIHVSRLVQNSKQAKQFGIKSRGNADLKKVMRYVKSKQEIIRTHENASHFRKIGMDVELGHAKFISKDTINVNGKNFTAKKIILATGSRPRKLNIPGIQKVDYLTNETIFELNKLPKRLLVIGGGPIGIELGQAFCRLGSKVTVIDPKNIFLPKEDPSISKVLLDKLTDEGMEFYFNSTPIRFKSKNEIVIRKKNKNISVKFDKVLVSIGRKLNIENLGLENADIQSKEGKIIVDDYLQTTNKKVLLCGDIAGSYMFTHAAELHAGVIINNFFSPLKKKLSYDKFSWVTYTSPEIATFGLNEAQLKQREINYEKLKYNFSEDDRAITDDYTDGKLILYISKGKVLGGTMVAMDAGELFQELVLANANDIDIKSIFSKTYPYPTASRANKRIISNYFSNKLTDTTKKVLRFLY